MKEYSLYMPSRVSILTAKSIVKVVEANLVVEERKPLEICKICFFCCDQVTVYNNTVSWSFGSAVFFLVVVMVTKFHKYCYTPLL